MLSTVDGTGSTFDASVLRLTQTPEPGTFAVAGIGIAVTVLVRRRR
jgi:hypothetical protein